MQQTIIGSSAQTSVANVAKVSNPYDPQPIISGIFVPFGWEMDITPGDSDLEVIADLEAELTDLCLHNTPASRAFYIGPFEQFDDKGEATQYQTLGYGGKFETRRSTIDKEYTITDGGVQYWGKVQRFKGKVNQFKWLEIDNNGAVCGTNALDPDTGLVSGIKGYQLSKISPQDRKQATGTAIEMHVLNLSFKKSSEANEHLCVIQTGKEFDSFVSALVIQDVTITAAGPMVAKVVDCAIVADGINLCETLPGLIVAASFEFKNTETASTTITLTSVAIVDGKARFTFAGAGAGWVPGNHMEIYLKSVSTLSAAGFNYYESTRPVCSVVMVA